MNHFTQVVLQTERNQTSEAFRKAARYTCNILQPTQHHSGLKFAWYSGAQRDVPSSTTHLLQQLSQDISYPWCHLARQGCPLFAGCFLSQHYYLLYNALFEYLSHGSWRNPLEIINLSAKTGENPTSAQIQNTTKIRSTNLWEEWTISSLF